MSTLILVINPGSTSTKVGCYKNEHLLHEKTIRHQEEDLRSFNHVIEQKDYRKKLVTNFLEDKKVQLKDVDVFVGRGGLLKPLKQSGTYLVNDDMINDLSEAKYGEHASNLGAIIAHELADLNHKKAYIVDPVCVDEMQDIARVSGLKGIERQSTFHALNQKAIARKYATSIHKPYEHLNLIVCHLGGGISVGLHEKGRVIDVNNALGGDGPFSPERTGTIPTYPLVDLCFSGKHTKEDIQKMLVGHGGLTSYLHTTDAVDIERQIQSGNMEAAFYFNAMAYRVVKEIGSLYFVSAGDIDAILITGGLAYNDTFINYLKMYIEPIKPLVVYPGEVEMQALANGVLRIITKKEKVKKYIA